MSEWVRTEDLRNMPVEGWAHNWLSTAADEIDRLRTLATAALDIQTEHLNNLRSTSGAGRLESRCVCVGCKMARALTGAPEL